MFFASSTGDLFNPRIELLNVTFFLLAGMSCVLSYMLWLVFYCHVCEWLLMGFGLALGFIEHLQIVTTSNCSAIANSHTQQLITACTKSSQSAVYSPVVAWSRLSMPLLPQLPCSCPYWPVTGSHLTDCSNCLACNILAWTAQRTPFVLSNIASNCLVLQSVFLYVLF
jgi:hypothetical protein